jgi:hypothetical protein
MNLDDIKDQLKERIHAVMARAQESSAWMQAQERFDSLSANAQKAIIAGAAVLAAFAILAFPWMYYSASKEAVAEFQEKKQLIRELFRVSRASAMLQNAPPSISSMDLESKARAQLGLAQLPSEQIRSIVEYDNAPKSGALIPKNVVQKGIQVVLTKLNLRQLVDIGHQMQTLHPSTRMVSMEVTANRDDTHYFDVIYRIVSFSIPMEAQPVEAPGKGVKPGAKGIKPPANPSSKPGASDGLED